jgi:hypothetical protein
MHAKSFIIILVVVTLLVQVILAGSYSNYQDENESLEKRRFALRELLDTLLANKRAYIQKLRAALKTTRIDRITKPRAQYFNTFIYKFICHVTLIIG